MAIYCSEDIYVGLGRKFINFSSQKILCIHDKCIRSISGNSDYIGCCSYDGTATVFTRNEKLVDKIEGPDTEIKGIAFYDNFIAITTRGKTTWILEDFEISKILEDHTQDVKGCAFHNKRLYTWSYDNTIKVYDLFDIDHSWELSQSIDLDDIVWSVIFFQEYMCATLQNGCIVVMEMKESLWMPYTTVRGSLTPIYCGTVVSKNECNYLCVVCNRNCLLILDYTFGKSARNSRPKRWMRNILLWSLLQLNCFRI
ncbi:uncharacterized protein VICG_01657 [Vittaforma corneae ATCC 50505]|uniref:Peroxin-7 n=1 Tax=Vittaforma corneae (strain ATCC 50505) TaxID=993615 RepID=L2GKX3_VITCO|nr:uncharacterized protein VICG_01657 [Vittaforma corneae ATCC 50505]ELA41284.1 hypothetical protein VICG_01657 [Vittaforma corneae ATCC 50505]